MDFKHLILKWIAFFLQVINSVSSFEFCNGSLGMESRHIKDSALSASSAYDSASVGPQHGRLRNDKNGGAWCPRPMVSKEAREFLEINLIDLYVITGTRTQGRYGNGQGQEYAEGYMLEFWRPGMSSFVKWKSRTEEKLLTGNTNTFAIVDQKLNPSIIASKIRFIPYSDHVRTVCMRVELLGCKWQDGLLSYSMPQGYLKDGLDLRDKIYDGTEENGRLFAGLGQLIDNHLGPDAFSSDGAKDSEWVGWKNDTSVLAGLPVEILFQFNVVRNFSAVHLHTNNLFTKGIQVFSHAKAFFALKDESFNSEPVQFSYMPDLILEHSRNVTIKLHNRLGRFVKLQLYFASRWILISEVKFDSESIGNFTEDDKAPIILQTTKEYPLQRDRSEDFTSPISVTRKRTVYYENKHIVKEKNVLNLSTNNESNYIGFVIGALSIIIILLVGAIVFIVFRNYKIKLLPSVSSSSFPTSVDDPLMQQKNKMLGETEKSIILTDDNKIKEDFNYSEPIKQGVPDVLSQKTEHCPSNTSINKKLPASLYLTFPKPPKDPPDTSYSEGDLLYSVPFRKPSLSLSHNNFENKRGASTWMLEKTEHSSKNCVGGDLKTSRSSFNIVEQVGKGMFVDVYICEVLNKNVTNRKQFGVVYILSSKRYREELFKEINRWIKLSHSNVAGVIGACVDEDPYFIIKDYCIMGDLCQFLQDHVAETASVLVPTARTLSYSCLIYMITQIAVGMNYLESIGFIHKDLAARNCLINENFNVKISDLGSYREMYSSDYCSIAGTRPLPIRWMPWEALLMGKFSSKSDVWSFAVTMWEILTFAREQPFEELSDDNVIENVTHFYQNDGKEILLSTPINCPEDVFKLMLKCWQRDESDRPLFRDISFFLQRKNLDFHPDLQ